jgi:hypothetical protein
MAPNGSKAFSKIMGKANVHKEKRTYNFYKYLRPF